MGFIKQLAGQTAVYGMGTVVPRFLNYALMTPFYTRIFRESEYGVVTELYAYMAILMILLTYGMETAYFRFVNKEETRENAYNTALLSLFITSTLFVILMIILARPVAGVLQYQAHPEYIIMFSVIIGIDAFTSIPFARLRVENRVMRFSVIKLINVFTIIGVAIMLLWILPVAAKRDPGSFTARIYPGDKGVGYVFIANMCGSIITLILLLPQIVNIKFRMDPALLRKFLVYALPLLVAGLAGVINDSFDKVAFKYLFHDKENALQQLGIYGANFKIAVLMGLFIQMFRYAAEPFFFSKSTERNAKEMYVEVMNYFVLFCFVLFLGIALNLEIFKYLIPDRYWGALNVVPVILLSYIFYGIFVNLSVWYKLNDITKYAAFLTTSGAIITITVNVCFVPKYGYQAAAWGHVAAYLVMVVLSFFLGKKYFPVPYKTGKLFGYFVITIGLFFLSGAIDTGRNILNLAINNLILLAFIVLVYIREIKGKNI